MKFVRYHDVKAFGEQVFPMLTQREAENNLMTSLVLRGMLQGGAEDWWMATVEDGLDVVRLAALMTPPHNLLIAGANHPSFLETLCHNLPAIPGVLAQSELAQAFAACHGGKFEVRMQERAYQLTRVCPVKRTGELRPACERDMHFLPYWYKAFMDDAYGTVNELQCEAVREYIRQGKLYVLEANGMPVCMAGNSRRTLNGQAVGPVYTPPFLRGSGYATDAVAQLSRRLLQEGAKFCALFTDMSNPASNKAYTRVGYQPVCDFTELTYLGE